MLRRRAKSPSKPPHFSGNSVSTARSGGLRRGGAHAFLRSALFALLALAVLAPPAFAIETHLFTGVTIGPKGKDAPGEFGYMQSVTVDPSTGDLYVFETKSRGRLYKFDDEGEPLNFAATGTNFIKEVPGAPTNSENQIAIAPPGSAGGTAGDIYVVSNSQVRIYSPQGLQIGEITAKTNAGQFCGVATDSAGTVFAKSLAFDNPIVTSYLPSGDPVTTDDESGHSIAPLGRGTCNLAVDGNGRIYAAGRGLGTSIERGEDKAEAGILRLQSLTAPTAETVDSLARTVAVEQGTNDFYAGHAKNIVQYAEDGSVVSEFGEGRLREASGVSIDGPGGKVYVANRNTSDEVDNFDGRVEVYGPLRNLPNAIAGTADTISKTSAVLHGTINADGGPEATCTFEYTTPAAYERRHEKQRLTVRAGGGTFTLSFVGPGGGPAQTTAAIAFNAEAEEVRAALAALPNMGGEANESVSVSGGPGDKTGSNPYTITFHGRFNVENLEQLSVDPSKLTEAQGPGAEVQTVADGNPGGFAGATSVPCAPAGPFTGESTEAVSAEISGLTAGSKYLYRLVGSNENGSLASNENGSEQGQVASFETLPAISVHTGAASNPTPTSVTLNGSINPEGVNVSECFFEYGKTKEYGSIVPCEDPGAAEIGTGDELVAVHADAKGLTESTEYHFRLSGTTSFGVTPGADVPFATVGHPKVLSQSFSEVDETAATVSGSINPEGEPTTYFVEYVTKAAFEEGEFTTAIKLPAEGLSIGEGHTGVNVSQRLTGLVPGTSYVFRLSATNDVGPATGPLESFTTQLPGALVGPCPENDAYRTGPSALLPDCRAYEQASSPEKNGGGVAGLYPLLLASEDGSAVTFFSPAGVLPPAERGGTQNYSTYLASRDAVAGSWSSQRLLPPEEFGEFAEFIGSTPDLRYALVEAASAENYGLFVIDTAGDGSVTQIVPYMPKVGEGINQFGFDGASADGSRVFFESKIALTTTPANPAPAPGHINLYMWQRATGDVSLVGVLPPDEGGEAPAGGSFGGSYEWYEAEDPSRGGAMNNPGNVAEPLAVAANHAISPSGDQIFFTAAGSGQLYLRSGLDTSSPTTVRISTPNEGVTGAAGGLPAAFQEATPDGSRAFFISREKLTANATTGPEEEGMDLYRWDAAAPASEALTDVAPDVGDENGAEVQGLLGVSPDGRAGYFVARGVLAAHAKPGRQNLYRFTEKTGGGFRIAFIAILGRDTEGQEPDRRNVSPKVSFGYQVGKTSRLSEDGTKLLFTSGESLTGYDNVNPEGISCGRGAEGRCPELYLYSSKTETLTCVSCNPTGEIPTGAASLQAQFFSAYFTPTEPPGVNPSRNFSADGTRVFFQTPDPLVAADTNGDAGCPSSAGSAGDRAGTARCQDVYEWEAAGSGSCAAAEVNGGCLYLLSTGKSTEPSFFVNASKDGSSAFIATTSQLVPSDRDQTDDVYDVRVGGGLAAQHATPPVPCGSSEACKEPASSPPPATAPGSSSFQGPGNPKQRRCKKGFVLKHGKCVKKHKHQKGKPSRHHRGNRRTTGNKHAGGAK